MKLILHKDRIIKAYGGEKVNYLSKKKYPNPPKNGYKGETANSWIVAAGSHPKAREDENHAEDEKKEAEAEAGQLAKLESPEEKVNVEASTSTKEKPPEVTKQDLLASGSGKKLGWKASKESLDYVKNHNENDEDFEASIEEIPIEDIDLPPPRDSGRTSSVKEGLRTGADMPAIRGGYQENGKFALDDGVHRTNAAKEAGATHVPAITFKPKKGADSSKASSLKDFNKQYAEVEKLMKESPDQFSSSDHRNIAHNASLAGAEDIAKKHKALADEAKIKESKERLDKIVQAKGAGVDNQKKPKRGKTSASTEEAKKKEASDAVEERKAKDFNQSIDKVSSYLNGLKERLPENSKEAKQIEEHLSVLANTKKEAPSTVGGYDVKAAYNLSAQIRNKVAASEDSKAKELANSVADRVEHETKLVEIASRVEKEIDNAVDPSKKKILEGHLKTLEAQMSNKRELGPLDKKDLARAESDYYSIAKQNIKDIEALPEKERKKLESDKKEKARLKAEEERKQAAKARSEESAKNKAARTAKQQESDNKKKAIAKQKLDIHKKDAGEARKQILAHITANNKNLDQSSMQKLLEHYKNLGEHEGIEELSPKQTTELSRAKSDLNSSNKKIEATNKKNASQAAQNNKKLVVQNTKAQEHKQHAKDTVAHIRSAMSAIGSDHPMHAQLEHHLNTVLKQSPVDGSFTKAHKKELMEAYSAASKAHREALKPEKAEKEQKPEKRTFFKEKVETSQAPQKRLDLRSSASSGRAFGSRVAEASAREEVAPAGKVAADTAVDGITSLFSGSNKPRNKDSVITSTKEKVKDDTKEKKETKKSLTIYPEEDLLLEANSLAKSLTPYNFLPGIDSFQKHLGAKVSKLTGRLRDEYYEHLNKALIRSIEDLDVG